MDIPRQEVLPRLRPLVAALLATIEDATDLQVRFSRLPATSHVSAGYAFDPHNNAATVSLGTSWDDVDVAHELTHMQLELVERYSVLAWRTPDSQTTSRYAIMQTIRGFTDDEVVHSRLRTAGFRLDGEILRPQLFADRCVTVPSNLRAARSLKNDGMAHQDQSGCGDLYRAMLFVQCHLIRTNHVDSLGKERLDVLDDFLAAFRRFRPRQFRKARAILDTFQRHDVHSVTGHAAILRELAAAEEVDQSMGLCVYRKEGGRYVLPWP